MNFLKNMFLDESEKPSSARIKQYLGFLMAVVFGIAGFYVGKETREYAHSLVIAFLMGGGASGVAGQIKSAMIVSRGGTAPPQNNKKGEKDGVPNEI